MVYVPAGRFLMGSTDAEINAQLRTNVGNTGEWFTNERPQSWVDVRGFWIDQYEVTNVQYAQFIADNGYTRRELWTELGWNWKQAGDLVKPKFWDDPKWNQPDHPMVGISWYEAVAYCRWAGARLPTEAEWEKAAGWDPQAGRRLQFPWGDKWDKTKANTSESHIASTTPVGKYCLDGASRYGACDMAGNVWEWVSSLYKPYPYDAGDGREDLEAKGTRVLRGGCWANPASEARTTFRLPPFPGDFILFDAVNGFRCAMSER
jgi:formylglycine-generating enzyme required for sulfatase activity